MHRIDETGHVDNKFVRSNPETGQPATILGATWPNAVQEEICKVVEDAGLTLDTEDQTQLKTAIETMIAEGGAVPATLTLTNNAGPLDVTGLVFDKTKIKSARVLFDTRRRTDTAQYKEMGEMFIIYDVDADAWEIEVDSKYDDAGVIFTITAAGQVQYTTDDIAGANYVGKLRFIDIKTIKI